MGHPLKGLDGGLFHFNNLWLTIRSKATSTAIIKTEPEKSRKYANFLRSSAVLQLRAERESEFDRKPMIIMAFVYHKKPLLGWFTRIKNR